MWRAWHLHYHDDQDRLLAALRPRWCRWLIDGRVERLFFVRYRLGGPHLRIRGEWADAADASRFETELRAWASAHFSLFPSTKTWSAERIARGDTELQSSDASVSEAIQSVGVPDESVVESAYQPEESRYGGPVVMPLNHEVFCLSSLAALHRARIDETERPGRLENLALVLKLLIAAASDRDDLGVLSRYPPESARRRHRTLIEKADALFDRQHELFERALTDAQGSLASSGGSPEDRLAHGLALLGRHVPREGRRRIVSSHVHMTLNRLGLDNREELLLLHWASRLVDRHGADVMSRDAPVPEPSPGPDSAPSSEARALVELRRLSQESLEDVTASAPESVD